MAIIDLTFDSLGGGLETLDFIGTPQYAADENVSVTSGNYYLLVTFRRGTDSLSVTGGTVITELSSAIQDMAATNSTYARVAIVKATSNQMKANGFWFYLTEITM